jgi:hypothetical protein
VTGKTIDTFPTTVDMQARSFLVAIPRSMMPVQGRWRIRLAAGLANAAGTGFAVPTLSGGVLASPAASRVYNVTFRTAAQEPAIYTSGPGDTLAAELAAALKNAALLGAYGARGIPGALTANAWSEDDQAETLATGSVAKFSQVVSWHALAARSRTGPPLVRGWSDRWYVSDLDLGQGVNGTASANPAFLSRVQPYAVYVPSDYTSRRSFPLTWLLHSADANYNQYGAINPRLVQEACQERDSICASTEGFGGDGLYQGDAEHDFWQVWRQLGLAYDVARARTVLSGYSMGGLASFVLPTTYPSDFSEAMPLDGGFDDGCSAATGEGTSQLDIAAATDRTTNVHWVPLVISNSYTDELSPYPAELINLQRYESAGDRVTLFSTTTPEHITTDLTDGFSSEVAALHRTPAAVSDPGTIDYTWCPNAVDPKLGLGPRSVYWLSQLSERDTATSATTAQIVARDGALPEPAETERVSATAISQPDAPPIQVTTGSWKQGPTPPASPTLTLTLTNVAALSVDAAAAKLARGAATVTTDGPTQLILKRLTPGTRVHTPKTTIHVSSARSATIVLSTGTSTFSWSPPARRRRRTHR